MSCRRDSAGEADQCERVTLVKTTSSNTAQSTGREAWIAVAKGALIKLGHSQVKIEQLAAALNVTRGGFYWHFKNRADLLASLLADWEATNSSAIIAAVEAPGTPEERLRNLAEVWIEEGSYSPAYNSAIRDWARVSSEAANVVARVDGRRIAALLGPFLDAGYAAAEALIRARITYYHQVGYYAMRVKEPKATRRGDLPLYISALLGSPGGLAGEHD